MLQDLEVWRREAREALTRRTESSQELLSQLDSETASPLTGPVPHVYEKLKTRDTGARARRWGAKCGVESGLPRYSALHAQRPRHSPRRDATRTSPRNAGLRTLAKSGSRSPVARRSVEGKSKMALEQALSPAFGRSRSSAPCRRASDRAKSQDPARRKCDSLVREARRALEGLAAAALSATLRCSKSQDLTASLLRRVLAETAELDQLSDRLQQPALAAAARERAHVILDEAKQANRLLAGALQALEDRPRRWGRRARSAATIPTAPGSREVQKPPPPSPGSDEGTARCTVMAALNEMVSGMRQALDDIRDLRQHAASKN